MKVALDISVPSVLWRGLPRARSLARETIAAAVAESGFGPPDGGEVSLCLADDALLRALNLRWRGVVRARSAAQDHYLAALRKHELVFAEGPAGTGKTWLAVGQAVSLL